MSVTSLGQSFNNIVQERAAVPDPSDQRGEAHRDGIGADLAKRYLDHPNYTPRDDLIFVEALHKLTGGNGTRPLPGDALKADDEVEAHFFVNTAQILRGYHEKRGRITGITMFEGPRGGPVGKRRRSSSPSPSTTASGHGTPTCSASTSRRPTAPRGSTAASSSG